ncbi:MAG TPA: hypothetical protein DCY79_16230 [Planctomycetaceae bacterium]|nr:hypothetical protein [Blastopirellula sp.]HAY81353.1 hypothetical protein [Planctomycetaceae bacterium]
MSDPKALAFSGLTQYRFRERGSGAIHNVSIDGLSTKQWRRFAQQLDSSRADFFRKSYRRFMGELADCQAADAADLTAAAEATEQMRRLKATLRVVREAAYQRMMRSWKKRNPISDAKKAAASIRKDAGEAAIKRLAEISAEQKELLTEGSFLQEVKSLRKAVTWCDASELRQMERQFRKRIGNVFSFIETTPKQLTAIRAKADAAPGQVQLEQRAAADGVDDFDVVAFLEDDEDDVMGRLVAESARSAVKFEVQTEANLRSERREQLLKKLESVSPDDGSRSAAEQQLAKMSLFRKPS